MTTAVVTEPHHVPIVSDPPIPCVAKRCFEGEVHVGVSENLKMGGSRDPWEMLTSGGGLFSFYKSHGVTGRETGSV